MSTGPVSFYPTHLDVCRADPVPWTPHEIGRFLHDLGLQNVEFDQWHSRTAPGKAKIPQIRPIATEVVFSTETTGMKYDQKSFSYR